MKRKKMKKNTIKTQKLIKSLKQLLKMLNETTIFRREIFFLLRILLNI